MKTFELVLPAYNEEKSLRKIVVRVIESAVKEGFNAEAFRLVLVNNGSTDNTPQVLKELMASPETAQWLEIVNVPTNRGYGNGIIAGLRRTDAEVIAWSHADEQCDPMDAFKGYQILHAKKGEKVLVKGVRSGRRLPDIIVSRIFDLFAFLLLGRRMYEINAQPKVFPRGLLNQLDAPPNNFAFDVYVLFKALQSGYHLQTIPVKFPPRVHGVSKWAATFFGRYRTIFGIISYMYQLGKKH